MEAQMATCSRNTISEIINDNRQIHPRNLNQAHHNQLHSRNSNHMEQSNQHRKSSSMSVASTSSQSRTSQESIQITSPEKKRIWQAQPTQNTTYSDVQENSAQYTHGTPDDDEPWSNMQDDTHTRTQLLVQQQEQTLMTTTQTSLPRIGISAQYQTTDLPEFYNESLKIHLPPCTTGHPYTIKNQEMLCKYTFKTSRDYLTAQMEKSVVSRPSSRCKRFG
jgi:E3 ubiquitin-protein ligase DOA10